MSKKHSLAYAEKLSVASAWTAKDYNQTELAQLFSVSRRTIQRALIEVGAMPPYRKTPCTMIGYDMGRSGGEHLVEIRGHVEGPQITVDEVIEKVIPSPEFTATLPPAAPPLTEQMTLRVPTIPCTRWVNVYNSGPCPVMHLSREHALQNRSERRHWIKTVPVAIPL